MRPGSASLVISSMREHLGEMGVPAPMESSEDAFAVLVSTIVSLRTRDAVTRDVSGRLLGRAPDPESMASLPLENIQELLKPAGFHRQKAGQLKRIAKILIEDHGGSVPSDIDQLLKLPGVGRKTANFVLGMVFGKPAICVDVHVHRISNRLGLVDAGTPEETEAQLQKIFPKDQWIGINHTMVRFGQRVCKPLGRLCPSCPFGDWCPSSTEGEAKQ